MRWHCGAPALARLGNNALVWLDLELAGTTFLIFFPGVIPLIPRRISF